MNIYQIKANLYKVPEIDNRSRSGFKMYQVVADQIGTDNAKATLHKLNGETTEVVFTALGWGEARPQ